MNIDMHLLLKFWMEGHEVGGGNNDIIIPYAKKKKKNSWLEFM